ncbi:MAG: hypothetical protein QM723_29890 [Myxococcaceae bacterium]
MSARSIGFSVAVSVWLLIIRVVVGLSCSVDGALALGVLPWTPANDSRLMVSPLEPVSAVIGLFVGLLITVGISTRFFVAVIAAQVAIGVGLLWLQTRASPLAQPNLGWLAFCLAVTGIFGPGLFSVDAWKPRLLPKLLLRLRSPDP